MKNAMAICLLLLANICWAVSGKSLHRKEMAVGRDGNGRVKPVEITFDCFPLAGNVLRNNPQQRNRTVRMAARIKVNVHCQQETVLDADFLMECATEESQNRIVDYKWNYDGPFTGEWRGCGYRLNANCRDGSDEMDISNVCTDECSERACEALVKEAEKKNDGERGEDNVPKRERSSEGKESESDDKMEDEEEEEEEGGKNGEEEEGTHPPEGDGEETAESSETTSNESIAHDDGAAVGDDAVSNKTVLIHCYPQESGSRQNKLQGFASDQNQAKYINGWARMKVFLHCPKGTKLVGDAELDCKSNYRYHYYNHLDKSGGAGGYGTSGCGYSFGVSCTSNQQVFLSYGCRNNCIKSACDLIEEENKKEERNGGEETQKSDVSH